MHFNFFRLQNSFLLFLMSGLFSACSTPRQVSPALSNPSAAPVVASVTPLPTNLPVPTETSKPSPTPVTLSTSTFTPAPTQTVPPTQDPFLSNDMKLSGLAWMKNYDLLLSFQFPGPVTDPQKYRVTLEDKEYRCELVEQYPNRLYCWGQGAKVLTTATIRVYQAGSDYVVFKKVVWVPYFQ